MRFVLNGEPQGVYVMTEHIGPQFLEARFGHSDFGIEDDANPRRLLRWARNVDVMTIETVSQTVDLENLTTWAISILFCGTTDVWQGTLARDQRDENSRWFWINWDMDHSFMDLYQRAPSPWEIDTYRTLLGVRVDARSRILTMLIEQDPAYRRRFAARLTEVLNHRLTPSFLQSRLEHYRLAAGMHGIDDRAFLDIIEDFFEHRPSVLLAQTPSYLRIAPAVPVVVNAADGRTLTIDGHPTSTPYRGMYFPQTSITIELPVELRESFAGWSVNERPAGTDWRLTLPVTSETSITAHFQD
jgi:hypothetical protein